MPHRVTLSGHKLASKCYVSSVDATLQGKREPRHHRRLMTGPGRRLGSGVSTPDRRCGLDGHRVGEALPAERRGGGPASGQAPRLAARSPASILGLVEGGTKDISLAEIAERLADERGVTIGITAIWTVLDPHGLTFKKKTAHAAEQHRPDVLEARQSWFDSQLDRDPEKLIVIDETGASTKMARLRGRCLCRAGARAHAVAGRHRRHGRSAGSRERRRAKRHRGGGRVAAAPPALQPGRQPDRTGLLQPQGAAPQSRRPHHPGPVGRHSRRHASLQPARLR